MDDFDVLVIGSGPSGQKAAIAAAKLDRRVAIVDRPSMVGGVCLNTGTIPSKTLREAVLYLTGTDQRELYGQSYQVKEEITVGDLTARTHHVVGREADVVRTQLHRNRVQFYEGSASFTDPNTIEVDGGPRTSRADPRGEDRHRDGDPPGPARQRSSSTEADHRLRRDAGSGPDPAVDGRRRAPASSASSTPRCSRPSAPR